MRNPYYILGVATNATKKQIEKAYDKEVKNAQRNITNEGALDTKLSELNWALTELLNENTRSKYTKLENSQVTIKSEDIKAKTKHLILKYILCIFLAVELCTKRPLANIYTYYLDFEDVLIAVGIALTIIFALLGLWLVNFIIKKLFFSDDAITALQVIRWVVIVLNSIIFISAMLTVSQNYGGDGLDTISMMIPDAITYAIIIIATLAFEKRTLKQIG